MRGFPATGTGVKPADGAGVIQYQPHRFCARFARGEVSDCSGDRRFHSGCVERLGAVGDARCAAPGDQAGPVVVGAPSDAALTRDMEFDACPSRAAGSQARQHRSYSMPRPVSNRRCSAVSVPSRCSHIRLGPGSAA